MKTMFKQWNVYGMRGEYFFLHTAAKCRTEADVRSWMNANHPGVQIKKIVED